MRLERCRIRGKARCGRDTEIDCAVSPTNQTPPHDRPRGDHTVDRPVDGGKRIAPYRLAAAPADGYSIEWQLFDTMAQPPLAHLRVVDLTDLRGALAGRMLADLGADVLKVSPPGDPDRLRPPFVGNVAAPDRSLPFLYRNANKRGTTLDLRTADGRRRLGELCAAADILVENLPQQTRREYGLTPEAVQSRHPHLVHVAIADFGLSGPRAEWRLEALPAFAASGALHASGFADHPPCWLPGYIAHDCAATFAVAGALAALLERSGTGTGQTVEVSVQEAALNGLYPWAVPLADYTRLYPVLPSAPPRNADGSYLVLPTAEGHVRVLAGTRRQWRGFLDLLGNPPTLSGPEWEAPILRLAAPDVIRLIAAEVLEKRERAAVVADALRLRVPLSPVNTPEEFVAAEQTRVRGYFRESGFPHLADAPFAPAPFNFSLTPAVLRQPAPAPEADDGNSFAGGQPARPPLQAPVFGDRASGGSGRPPLAGFRVVNLGVGAVVPEACWLLSELGAEVFKIESRANLDFLRAVTIEPDTPNRAWTFNSEARGQKSVCLDLGTPTGRDLALQLCATADVVVENNRGGVVVDWRLDYEDVRRVRPDIIYLASQGFGRGGPLGEAPAFGPLNSSFSGANWLWNHPNTPYPAGSSLNHPDHIASKLAAVAVLAAIMHRQRTGEGQFIEMAQTEATAYLQGEFYLEGPCTGRPTEQRGNAVAYAVPHGVYPCAGGEGHLDRWCAVAVVGDDMWLRFARCLGWESEPRYATLGGRLAARAEIDARVAEWTAVRTAEAAAATLQAAGVSAFMVQSPDDIRADPHLAARNAIISVEHPEVGTEHHGANPLRLGRTPLTAAGAAPLLGEHTEEVLSRVLGLSPDAIARLVAEGVCR
jgi:crotonobetainyl-CoA:carnitine CoA-transferase CaiB-like acyl-CoA transferase